MLWLVKKTATGFFLNLKVLSQPWGSSCVPGVCSVHSLWSPVPPPPVKSSAVSGSSTLPGNQNLISIFQCLYEVTRLYSLKTVLACLCETN